MKGFASSILLGIKDVLDRQKAGLGIRDVFVGERRKGWQTPAVFVYLGPNGVALREDSGVNKLADYNINIRIVLLVKSLNESLDAEVIKKLECILDEIDACIAARESCFHGAHLTQFAGLDVLPDFVDPSGRYDTVGVLDLTFRKVLDRSRASAP